LTQAYFHGHATARRAGEILSAPPKTQGGYLVRFSASSYGCFVISALRGSQCANFTVQRHEGKYVATASDCQPVSDCENFDVRATVMYVYMYVCMLTMYNNNNNNNRYYLPNGDPYDSISELLANESTSLGLSSHVPSQLSFSANLHISYRAPEMKVGE
jgi:hypothetical protein